MRTSHCITILVAVVVSGCVPDLPNQTGTPNAPGSSGDLRPMFCQQVTCRGREPKGTFVTISHHRELDCGQTENNASCLVDVGNAPVGTTRAVCRDSNRPDGWDKVGEDYMSAACGTGPGTAMDIVRKR